MTSEKETDESARADSGVDTTVYHVTSVGNIEPNERLVFTIKGQKIVVVNTGSEFYAIGNYCRHQGGPMCEGRLLNPVDMTEIDNEWELRQDPNVPTIACPWHGWEYNLKTGEHVAPTDYKLPTYDTFVEDEELYIEV